jgi:uncharacterized protein YecE (DUF72 family)
MQMGDIHIGLSGWSYKEWKGDFYPSTLKSKDWLQFYAQKFDITEINSSFYRLPLKTTVESWAEKVPKGFLFCPKLNRYVTHLKRLKQPEEPLSSFFEVFDALKDKIGPILIQLPPSLAFDESVTDYFFSVLNKYYSQYQFALEARHESWHTAKCLELLKAYRIAFFISHSNNYFPYAEEITADNIYVRFHGPSQLYNSSYDQATLEKYGLKFLEWARSGKTIWIFFNNTMNGHAIQNALFLEFFCMSSQ